VERRKKAKERGGIGRKGNESRSRGAGRREGGAFSCEAHAGGRGGRAARPVRGWRRRTAAAAAAAAAAIRRFSAAPELNGAEGRVRAGRAPGPFGWADVGER
jgi:hypothetical protein